MKQAAGKGPARAVAGDGRRSRPAASRAGSGRRSAQAHLDATGQPGPLSGADRVWLLGRGDPRVAQIEAGRTHRPLDRLPGGGQRQAPPSQLAPQRVHELPERLVTRKLPAGRFVQALHPHQGRPGRRRPPARTSPARQPARPARAARAARPTNQSDRARTGPAPRGPARRRRCGTAPPDRPARHRGAAGPPYAPRRCGSHCRAASTARGPASRRDDRQVGTAGAVRQQRRRGTLEPFMLGDSTPDLHPHRPPDTPPRARRAAPRARVTGPSAASRRPTQPSRLVSPPTRAQIPAHLPAPLSKRGRHRSTEATTDVTPLRMSTTSMLWPSCTQRQPNSSEAELAEGRQPARVSAALRSSCGTVKSRPTERRGAHPRTPLRRSRSVTLRRWLRLPLARPLPPRQHASYSRSPTSPVGLPRRQLPRGRRRRAQTAAGRRSRTAAQLLDLVSARRRDADRS